jgi:hypothetical protein
MKDLIERAKALVDTYANLDDFEDEAGTEQMLEDAMNIITEFIDKSK